MVCETRIPKRLAAALAMGAALLALAGCSPGDRPELAPVRGKVTLDGAPLHPGIVIFQPATGRASMGRIQTDGSYELTYIRDIPGAMLGNHTVRISDGQEDPRNSRVPPRYNGESELSAIVENGENTFDFDLHSRNE